MRLNLETEMAKLDQHIVLDPETHIYTVNGIPKRSLSSILEPLKEPFPEEAYERVSNAKHRGIQIDAICNLIMEGREADITRYLSELDDTQRAAWETESRPFVEAYRKYWTPNQHLVSVQTALYCPTLDFCCTPDWFDQPSVNDLKATDKPSRMWGLQTAGQFLAHGSATVRRIIWLRPKLKTRSYEVHTNHEGNPKIFSALDFDVLKAACQGDYEADVIRRWREGD